MAEPIGIASGLLALDTFAFTSSVSLYQAVESFQNNQRTIRELKEELGMGQHQTMPYHLRSGLGACRPSRTNVFEDVSAAQDAHQVIAATFGDLISAKRVTAGVGATQC